MNSKTKEVQITRAYRKLFGSKDGELVLQDLMASSYMLNSTASSDPIEMAAREGRRQVVLEILSRVNESEKALALRMKQFEEQNQEDKS